MPRDITRMTAGSSLRHVFGPGPNQPKLPNGPTQRPLLWHVLCPNTPPWSADGRRSIQQLTTTVSACEHLPQPRLGTLMYTQALTESQPTAVKKFIPISLQLQSCTSSNTYKRLYSCKRTLEQTAQAHRDSTRPTPSLCRHTALSTSNSSTCFVYGTTNAMSAPLTPCPSVAGICTQPSPSPEPLPSPPTSCSTACQHDSSCARLAQPPQHPCPPFPTLSSVLQRCWLSH